MQPQLYSPGAGHQPPELAGRQELLDAWSVMLNAVASDGRRAARDTILVGLRGVGKTVLLERLAGIATQAGFAVLALQGNPQASLVSGLLDRARERADAEEGPWRKAATALAQLGSVSVGAAGVSVGLGRRTQFPAPVEPNPFDPVPLARALADLATGLRREHHRGGVMLWIDEVQSCAPTDLATLGGALNHLNSRLGAAPVIFAAAGLPNTPDVLVGDPEHPVVSNPERLFSFVTLPPYLERTAAAQAIVAPARGRGVAWHAAAVDRVLAASKCYPAHLQHFAAAVWSHAHGPYQVTAADADAAIPRAGAEIAANYLAPRWGRLTDAQREYLAALALLGGRAGSGQVAKVLGRTTSALSSLRQALLNRGEIYAPQYGQVEMTMPTMPEFVLAAYEQARDLADDSAALAPLDELRGRLPRA